MKPVKVLVTSRLEELHACMVNSNCYWLLNSLMQHRFMQLYTKGFQASVLPFFWVSVYFCYAFCCLILVIP